MTPASAKQIVLAIVKRWSKKTIWLVKWPVDDGNGSDCRWFRSEEKARAYADMILHAVISKETYHGDDCPTLCDDQAPGVAVRYHD